MSVLKFNVTKLRKEKFITNKATHEVIWRTYPDIDFLQVNQFGEIRTIDHYTACKDGVKRFIKGHVLKQCATTGGYLCVHPYVNGNLVPLRVHRVVATCFLPNPDNLQEVNHKDSNPKNNSASNLEWCNHKYNMIYREKHGKAQGRPLYAVKLKTLEVLFFESQHEAARQLGIDQGRICHVLKGELKTAGGYWFTRDKSEITAEKIQKIKDGTVSRDGVMAVNLKTLEVSYFESQREAARQLNIPKSSTNAVLKGQLKKTHGVWLCCADSNAVEKIRAKFGDEVASQLN